MTDEPFKKIDRGPVVRDAASLDDDDDGVVLTPHDTTPGIYLLISIRVAPGNRHPADDDETPPAAGIAVMSLLEEAGYRCVSGRIQWSEVMDESDTALLGRHAPIPIPIKTHA